MLQVDTNSQFSVLPAYTAQKTDFRLNSLYVNIPFFAFSLNIYVEDCLNILFWPILATLSAFWRKFLSRNIRKRHILTFWRKKSEIIGWSSSNNFLFFFKNFLLLEMLLLGLFMNIWGTFCGLNSRKQVVLTESRQKSEFWIVFLPEMGKNRFSDNPPHK